MDAGKWAFILMFLSGVMVGEALWIWRLTKNYNRLLGALSRASAKVAQHKILVTELRELVEDDEDLDRCLREEVAGKIYDRAKEVRYEQNKASGRDEIPWIPKE